MVLISCRVSSYSAAVRRNDLRIAANGQLGRANEVTVETNTSNCEDVGQIVADVVHVLLHIYQLIVCHLVSVSYT